MEAIWNIEIGLIAGIQTSLIWLAGFFKAVTFLGSEEFFILVMPVLYWCVDTSIGLRIGIILLLSGHINGVFKVLFHSPRPFWYSQDIKALSTETSFGMPSGHAMNTASIWGLAAVLSKKKWFAILSAVVIFLVGFSRLVLGMHFISDVIVGWALGLILLLLFVKLDKPVSGWLAKRRLSELYWVVLLSTAFLIFIGYLAVAITGKPPLPADWIQNAINANPNAMPVPYDSSGIFTTAGVWLGMGIGAAWLFRHGGLPKTVTPRDQILRYIIGLTGIAVFWFGLGAILPRGEELMPIILRLVRYTLLGLWIGGGAPLVFKKLGLSPIPQNNA
jgi:membrane-associated phospholipid phosphatase